MHHFISLFYPRLCESCNNALLIHEDTICTLCLTRLPQTKFHTQAENPVTRTFWGRVVIENAASMFYFQKGSNIQHLVHKLKYKGKYNIGIYFGKLYGHQLAKTELFGAIDYIVPVPLHPKREKKRGYNQSYMFAKGLSESMKRPVDIKTLIRTTASETQTKKTRFRRWENVKEIFTVTNFSHMENKHILLVDDVLTTGATIEACANKLSVIPGIRISVVSIACSVK